MEEPKFLDKVRDWWLEVNGEGWAGFKLSKKLKLLKVKIKEWAKEQFGDIVEEKINLWEKFNCWILRKNLTVIVDGVASKNKFERDSLEEVERRRDKVEANIAM